jgi:hypothetical protein
MGLQGSIFYMGMRRWVYGLTAFDSKTEPFDEIFIHDRVRGYLLAIEEVLEQGAACKTSIRSKPNSLEERLPWPIH